MVYDVLLTNDAVEDLRQLDDYISSQDSQEKADGLLNKIKEKLNSLAHLPDRGSYPKELSELGIREYREIFFKPYRMIYRVLGNTVFVYVIADGRRNMEALLNRRILGVR